MQNRPTWFCDKDYCKRRVTATASSAKLKLRNLELMTTLLFTIEISATYRGTQEIYSAQAIACNGEKLYHATEAPSISEAVEQLVKQMKLQERNSGKFK